MKIEILIVVIICAFAPVIYALVGKRKDSGQGVSPNEVKESEGNIINRSIKIEEPDDSDLAYDEKLNRAKTSYPFKSWREAFDDGLTQYTDENCDKIQKIFDDLIETLIVKGENASELDKIKVFEIAILKTNKLNDQIEGLIETMEREDLCELTNVITIACGLTPGKYGEGEGLATEWRDW